MLIFQEQHLLHKEKYIFCTLILYEPKIVNCEIYAECRYFLASRVQGKMAVVRGTAEKHDAKAKIQRQEAEERKLAEMMIPKKKKQLYKKIMFGRKRKLNEVGF